MFSCILVSTDQPKHTVTRRYPVIPYFLTQHCFSLLIQSVFQLPFSKSCHRMKNMFSIFCFFFLIFFAQQQTSKHLYAAHSYIFVIPILCLALLKTFPKVPTNDIEAQLPQRTPCTRPTNNALGSLKCFSQKCVKVFV